MIAEAKQATVASLKKLNETYEEAERAKKGQKELDAPLMASDALHAFEKAFVERFLGAGGPDIGVPSYSIMFEISQYFE